MQVFILEDSNSRIILFREVLAADPTSDVFITDDVVEAVVKFKPPYDLILLDHDLSHEHENEAFTGQTPTDHTGSGTEFAQWLAKTQDPALCPVVIHSHNPAGAERMFQALTSSGWSVYKQPFGLVLLDKLRRLVKETLATPLQGVVDSPNPLDNGPVSE